MPLIRSAPQKVRTVAAASPESGKPASYAKCPKEATECYWGIKFADQAHTCTVVPWIYFGAPVNDYFQVGDPVDITGNTGFRQYTGDGVFLQVTALSNDVDLNVMWIEKDA